MKKILTVGLFLITSFLNILAQNTLEQVKLLAKEKKFEEAKNILEEIVDNNNKNAEAFFLLGKMNMALRNFEDASDSFEKLLN